MGEVADFAAARAERAQQSAEAPLQSAPIRASAPHRNPVGVLADALADAYGMIVHLSGNIITLRDAEIGSRALIKTLERRIEALESAQAGRGMRVHPTSRIET